MNADMLVFIFLEPSKFAVKHPSNFYFPVAKIPQRPFFPLLAPFHFDVYFHISNHLMLSFIDRAITYSLLMQFLKVLQRFSGNLQSDKQLWVNLMRIPLMVKLEKIFDLLINLILITVHT